ncbi:MAG TPA: hypothetical protein VKN99_26315 [Polyangia bacterium]|nr:hypothetical protein [Polyangia bacterium]
MQTGDACARNAECCSGTCTIASGATVGTCAPPPAGASFCSGSVDGSLCQDCTGCCSRLCAPYAATGIKICQPAQGCRTDGNLCQTDSDCCGATGSGLPGDGNVRCDKASPTDLVGICRNPLSCNPEGNVCHFMNYACSISSARNDCCGAVGNSGVCRLDPLGVPRCYGLGNMCRQAGETCSSAADCCNGVPCIPDSNGVLRCLTPPDGGPACSPSGGSCTANADCCPGLTCTIPTGSTRGTCGTTPYDGGACSMFGQMCNASQPCCMGLSCYVTGSNPPTACPSGQTNGCTCLTIIP